MIAREHNGVLHVHKPNTQVAPCNGRLSAQLYLIETACEASVVGVLTDLVPDEGATCIMCLAKGLPR